MKNLLTLLCGLFPLLLNAQLHENFTKNEFPEAQTKWRGHTFAFGINSDSLLQSQTINTTYISTENQLALGAVWEFGIRLAFNPSPQNQLRIYLIADHDTLTSPLNGYFVQIGENGATDRYHLYKQQGEELALLLSSSPKHRDNPAQIEDRIKVLRDSTGNWELFTAIDQADEFTSEGVVMDSSFTQTAFFGIHCRFTSANSSGFFFDYFSIDTLSSRIMPVILPEVSSIEVSNDTTLHIIFNSLLDSTSATATENYSLNNDYGHPISATLTDSLVTLVFDQPFISSNYTLTINNVADMAGTAIAAGTEVQFSYTAPEPPETKLLPDDTDGAWFYDGFSAGSLLDHWLGDTTFFEITDGRVQINDSATSPVSLSTSSERLQNTVWEAGIQVDGTLSSSNYVRLYLSATNDSLRGPQQGYHLQIDGSGGNHAYHLWRQNGSSRSRIFQSNPIPNQQGKFRARVRVIRDNEANWRIFADEYDQGVFEPVLSIDGDSSIMNDAHTTSGYAGYSVNFTPTRRGDYKLDYLLIRPLDPAADPVPDSIPPKIVSANFVDSLSLYVLFDKPVDPMSASDTINYSLNGAHPQHVETTEQEVKLTYVDSFETGEYSLSVDNIKNKDGFAMEADTLLVLHYTKTHAIQPNDIIINEILSYPKPDGVDFLEIYNHSSNIVDLQELYVANVNTKYVVGSLRKVSDEQHLFYPGEYKVLTTNPTIVKQHYPTALLHTFIEMTTLPNFNNETGGVVLFSNGMTIDSLFYTPAMQSPFINNHRGISLERQSFAIPTLAPGNFRSAATSIGGATPGYLNSQGDAEETETNLFLTSKTFSPDNDGFEDLLEINYNFPAVGYMANVDIYNDRGQLVRKLQRNQSLATQGTITWDGLSDTKQRLPVGIYIAVIELYNAHGLRKIHRKSFVLAAKL